MVQRLEPRLPGSCMAEPRVHLGEYFEIDNWAYEDEAPQPNLTIDAELGDEYAYEVKVYDQSCARLLVAAVEIVSPGNKDRKASRRAFVTKCAALLQQGVCVSIVDIVTTRKFNLYNELLDLIEQSDPAFSPNPPATYAVTCRARNIDDTGRFESWAYPLAVGQPLPDLPIWLSDDVNVSLELEASYEDTCRVLRIA